MNESEFQEIVIKKLRNIHNNIYVLNTCMRYSIGIPDLFISLNGRFISIELKVSKQNRIKLKRLFPTHRRQLITMNDIENSGSKAYGLIRLQDKVILFRLNYYKFPINKFFKHINDLEVNTVSGQNEFLEYHIDRFYNIENLLRKI